MRSSMTNNACDACRKAQKKCLFVVRPFRPQGQRSSCPRQPHKDSFVVDDDETISEGEWMPGPQTGRWEQFRTISPVPSSIDLSTPPPRPPSGGWRWQEDIRAWADRHHVLSLMGFKRQ
ncbi:hypothetical protein O181_120649, partial [Austropuccinia psidii MF-1]|nr:hypothetical protein [Austropuccinia psidii MF-1]